MTLLEILRKASNRPTLELYKQSDIASQWEEWWKGKVASFHNYQLYMGKKWIPQIRFTLGMAKKIAEDWANLLVNEKTDITLVDEASQNTLNGILRTCHFWQKANASIEQTFAIGNGAWVVSVKGLSVKDDGVIVDNTGAAVNVSTVYGRNIYPITIEDGVITECAFVRRDTKYTYISAHIKGEDGNYRIHNIKGETQKGSDDISFSGEDYYVFDTKSTLPWFACIKPNIVNNIDPDSPLGISIFANAIDILKEIDIVYDSYQNEFVLGRKRIFVNARNWSVDKESGDSQNTFDSNDVAFYVLPEADDDASMFVQNDTQALRVGDHQLAIQNQLNLLSYACGFGTQHYRYDAGGISTATQVVSENSEMFRNIKKHEILIEDALVTIVKAIIYATNTFTTERIAESTDIQVMFDDSIIEDKQAEMANDRMDVSMGVMSKAEYRAKWYNEDLETAQAAIDEMNSMTITDDEETPPFGGSEE